VRILALFAAALVVHGLSAQTRFKTGIDLVEADAVVVDASGRPVRDLGPADFTLTVDGKPRAIESVAYVDVSAAATESSHGAGRHIVFVVDEGNIAAGGGKAAIAATKRLLDQLGPTDRVALLSIPSGPTVDFTSQHAPIRDALDRAIGRAARPSGADDHNLSLQETFAFDIGATADERSMQQTILFRECPAAMPTRDECEASVRAEVLSRLQSYRERSRDTIAGLDKLFRGLAPMQGPKTVVLISESLLARPDLRDSSGVSQLAKTAALSRVALYSVLLEGALIDSRASSSVLDRSIEEQGLTALTSESGGLLFRAAAAPDEAFRRLAAVLAGYYLVTFQVTTADVEGPHQIKLQVSRSGIRVHARAQFAMSKITPRTTAAGATGEGSTAKPSRRADAASTFTIDKSTLQLATRSIADANGTVRILFSLDVRDPSAHETSALALGYKLKLGDRIVADTGRLVPVQREPDGTAQPISFIAFQGLAPGTYELQLSASDGTKHSAFVKHIVAARLHPIGDYTLSDLLIAASASTPNGPFPVPAQLVVRDRIVMGVEVAAAERANFTNAAVRFAAVSASNRDVLASQDIPLAADGPTMQFVRAALSLAASTPADCFAQASIVLDGKIVGTVDAPFRIVRE
jgi:VWFA-related protein